MVSVKRPSLKRLYEISVWDDRDPYASPNKLLAIADDRWDVCSLVKRPATRIARLVELPGHIAVIGPSRVLGSARVLWSAGPH